MVTCYDAAFARLVDDSGVDMVLVGDSLGNVMLGHDSTIPVTLNDMIHHSAAVARTLSKPFLVIDMPFMTYHVSVEQALANCGRAIQEGGAQAVKIEGGKAVCPQVAALVGAGIPVMGHLGLTPQSVHALGGYKIQGRGDAARKKLLEEAKALETAGVFALVLEMVPSSLAAEVSRALSIPTIGIGAGPDCDGQVLVLHDLLGFDDEFNPKFLKKYANLGKTIRDALARYDQEVKAGEFPGQAQTFLE
jgi:3-methyl-2-oxobutanoate hydroxymethyltransferase